MELVRQPTERIDDPARGVQPALWFCDMLSILKNIDQNSVMLEQLGEPKIRVQLLDLPGRHTNQQTLHTQFGDQLDNRIVIAVLRRDTQARELLNSWWF